MFFANLFDNNVILGEAIKGLKCNDSDICIKQLNCTEGHPVCYYRTNVCYCRLPHDNQPFRCKTTADCARQLECLPGGIPSCFARTQVCYCKVPNSLPNYNETMCNSDADCGVLLKCNLDPYNSPTCYMKTHRCYCKIPSQPPIGSPPSGTANKQPDDL